MRALPLALIPFLLAGCLGPGVYGQGPVKDCGTTATPAEALMQGVEASWVGVEFQSNGPQTQAWLEGTKSDAQYWGTRAVEAWAIVAIDPDASPPGIRDARGALGRYPALATSVGAANVQLAKPFTGPASGAGDQLRLMEPVAVQPGERLLLFVATTQAVPDMEFRVRWIGCGQTSDVIGDPSPGFAVGWPELAGPIAVSSASLGAVGYEARFERSTQEGVLLAMAPPGQGPITKAQLAYSQGSIELGPKPQFVAHQGGALAYTTTHVGSSDSAKSPLLVYFPLPLESIQGGYHRNATRIGET